METVTEQEGDTMSTRSEGPTFIPGRTWPSCYTSAGTHLDVVETATEDDTVVLSVTPQMPGERLFVHLDVEQFRELVSDGLRRLILIGGRKAAVEAAADPAERPAIGEAEEVTVTLPAATGWADVAAEGGEDTAAPWWGTRWGRSTAFTGGVHLGDDDYREDLAELRAEALAMLAAVNAAERYQARRAARSILHGTDREKRRPDPNSGGGYGHGSGGDGG